MILFVLLHIYISFLEVAVIQNQFPLALPLQIFFVFDGCGLLVVTFRLNLKQLEPKSVTLGVPYIEIEIVLIFRNDSVYALYVQISKVY